MIKEEIIEIGGKEFVRHFTDEPIYDEEGNELPRLIQVETGIEFVDAVDIIPCPFTYVEKPDEEPVEDPLTIAGEESGEPVEA